MTITISTLLSLHVAYNKLLGLPSNVAILERPLFDLYSHIGYVTIPIAWTYYYLGTSSPSALSTILHSIRSGNFTMCFLCMFLRRHAANPNMTFRFIRIISTHILYSYLETEKSISDIIYGVLYISFCIYEIWITRHRHPESDTFQHHGKHTSKDQGITREQFRSIWQVIPPVSFALLSIIYLSQLWKQYYFHCVPQATFIQAIPVLALIKPLSSFYCMLSLTFRKKYFI